MSINDILGRGGRLNLGNGYSLPPEPAPETQSAIMQSFDGGVNVSMPPEHLPPNVASYALDMEVGRDSALRRSPGIVTLQDLSPRDIQYLFEQVSLDYAVELVAIDPPYICVKASGDMSCADESIGATGPHGWHAISIAGTLLFSNGDNLTYTKAFGGTSVTDISTEIVAKAFAQIFGRVFAGGVKLGGGSYQALGLAWSSSADPIADWSGAGSGAELLIADQQKADKIVSLRSIGFDVLGILNRNSLWAGYPTGDPNRPADPRPRVMSVGCVNGYVACTTPIGIIMLSDDGVIVYDINTATMISKEINAAILPLDYSRLQEYRAVYDPYRQRYMLKTPFDLWYYDLPQRGREGRWFHRSAIVGGLIHFATQEGAYAWDQAVGSWDEAEGTWEEAVQEQSDAPGIMHYAQGSLLGIESQDAESNFGVAFDSIWRTPFFVRDKITDQYIIEGFELTFSTSSVCTIELRITNSAGAYVGSVIQKTLPDTGSVVQRAVINKLMAGMNCTVEIRITSGKPRILHLRQLIKHSGPRIETI